jgi:hypothetical protein
MGLEVGLSRTRAYQDLSLQSRIETSASIFHTGNILVIDGGRLVKDP